MQTNITFRSSLMGSLVDFCEACGLPLLTSTSVMVELVSLISRYKEEGVDLHPRVYVTNDINLCNQMIGNAEKIQIGNNVSGGEGVKLALKKCAPLAIGPWCIYIHDKNGEIDFGLFRGSAGIKSVPVDDVLFDEPNPDFHIVKIYQITDQCVEVVSANNETLYIYFNHEKDDAPPPLQFLNNLIASICGNIQKNESVSSFLNNVLSDGLRRSHGCLIAVTAMKKPPAFLSDGVFLKEPIDLYSIINDVTKTPENFELLSSKVDLIKGMLNSDGIILFDNNARLIGYNCFIKLSKKANSVVGGARRRAFSALKNGVGKKGIVAAYMQSQDGLTEYEEINNGN